MNMTTKDLQKIVPASLDVETSRVVLPYVRVPKVGHSLILPHG